MSKHLTRVFLALVLALFCQAQQVRTATTSQGTFTSCLDGTSVIGVQLRYSPNGAFAVIYRDGKLWRVDLSTCGTTQLLTPPSTVSYNYDGAVANDGTIYINGIQKDANGGHTGIFRINPTDNSVIPVIIDGQTQSFGPTAYSGPPIISRDGKFVYISAIANNQGSMISYDTDKKVLSLLESTKSITDPNFVPFAAESDIVYGYLTRGNNLDSSSRIATYDVRSKTISTIIGLNPTVGENVYDLGVYKGNMGYGTFQVASSKQGLLFTAERHGSQVTDLLFYSLSTKQLTRVGSNSVTPDTWLSMNYNGESAFDTRLPGANFTSSIYTFNQDITPAPATVADPANCPFTGETQCNEYFPSMAEDGHITFVYDRLVLGQLVFSIVTFRPAKPYIFPQGIAGSASGAGQATRLDWISVYGHGLADCTDTPVKNGVFLTSGCTGNGTLPVQVLVNGITAPLWYVSPGQINVQVPKEIAVGANATVQVVKGSQLSNPQTISITSLAPAFFQYNGTAIATHADGSLVTTAAPAAFGEYVSMWAAGLGETVSDPENGCGFGATPLPTTRNPVQITIGGTQVTPEYAGGAPTLAGLWQVVVKVPVPANGPQPGDVGPVRVVLNTLGVGGQTATSTIAVGNGPPPPPKP